MFHALISPGGEQPRRLFCARASPEQQVKRKRGSVIPQKKPTGISVRQALWVMIFVYRHTASGSSSEDEFVEDVDVVEKNVNTGVLLEKVLFVASDTRINDSVRSKMLTMSCLPTPARRCSVT